MSAALWEETPTEQNPGRRREAAVAPRRPPPAAIVHEFAESRRRSDARRGGEELYRALYESVPLMYFQLDREGKVLSVNEHGARELGYAAGELLGRPVLRVFHPEDRPAAERQLQWALEFPRAVSRWELRKIRKDGGVLWVRETVRVVAGPDGAPRILVVCEDVSERRRAVERVGEYRQQLRELNAEILRAEEREERRIARVLHDELGQTLAAARMTVYELRNPSLAPDVRARRVEELRELVDRSIEATRSLAYRLSSPVLQDLGLAAALQALGERTAVDHGFRFDFALGEGWTPPAEEAGGVLYRVVRELLHNVTKHARARCVRLALDGTRDRLRIVLADDGLGFDVAAAGRAAAGRTGAGGPGRSLGLFHVRERMARLGGGFEVDSAPGRGTQVRLTLPLGGWIERRRRDRRKPS